MPAKLSSAIISNHWHISVLHFKVVQLSEKQVFGKGQGRQKVAGMLIVTNSVRMQGDEAGLQVATLPALDHPYKE